MNLIVYELAKDFPPKEWDVISRASASPDALVQSLMTIIVEMWERSEAKYSELAKENNDILDDNHYLGTLKTPPRKGGRPRYGEDPEQAHHVLRMKQWRRQGWSFLKIARQLLADKVPTASGKRWHPETVKKIIERKPKRKRPKRIIEE